MKATVEVRGVNTHNKGAHLMMLAVAKAIGGGVSVAMSPNGSAFADRASAGYRQTLILNQAPLVSGYVGAALPSSLRNMFGLVSHREIDAVLDASGFAYSDSFSPKRAERELRVVSRLLRKELPYIFLPQAFGPFDKESVRRPVRELVTRADLVYARDKRSQEYLASLSKSIEPKLAPDFTVGLDVSQVHRRIEGDYGAIVPNEKLVTQGRISQREYVSYLVKSAQVMKSKGIAPVLVVHEFNDLKLAEAVALTTGASIFVDPDPLVLKRVLGDAQVAVASRFHAIVSALSLSTPVVAFGWSHKYEELMSDFGVSEWLAAGGENLDGILRNALETPAAVVNRLSERVTSVKQKNARMWEEVTQLVAARSPLGAAGRPGEKS